MANLTTCICVVCRETYQASPSRLARGTKYCSSACANSARRVWRECPSCHQFKVRNQDTYCGRACYNVARKLQSARARTWCPCGRYEAQANGLCFACNSDQEDTAKLDRLFVDMVEAECPDKAQLVRQALGV